MCKKCKQTQQTKQTNKYIKNTQTQQTQSSKYKKFREINFTKLGSMKWYNDFFFPLQVRHDHIKIDMYLEISLAFQNIYLFVSDKLAIPVSIKYDLFLKLNPKHW